MSADGGPRRPRVTRTKTTELESRDDEKYRLTARLTDVSSDGEHGSGARAAVIHDFLLEAEVEGPDLVLTALEVHALSHPYAVCPAVLPACQALVGTSLASGWRRSVLGLLGAGAGCTHVTTLLLGLGEVRTQAFFLRMNAEVPYTAETRDDGSWTAAGLRLAPSIVGACHALGDQGPTVAAARSASTQDPTRRRQGGERRVGRP